MVGLEEGLTEAMRSATAEVPVPPGLAEGGLRRARRIRRNRTLAVTAATTVAVASVVAGATVALLPDRTVRDQPAVARPTASPPADMIGKLESLLPPGRYTRPEIRSHPGTDGLQLVLTVGLIYDRGTGPHKLLLIFQRSSGDDTRLPRCPPASNGPGRFCVTLPQPGGGELVLRNGIAYPADIMGGSGLFALLVRPGKAVIRMAVSDRPDAGAHSTLTPDDLRRVVTSPIWNVPTASLPTASGSSS